MSLNENLPLRSLPAANSPDDLSQRRATSLTLIPLTNNEISSELFSLPDQAELGKIFHQLMDILDKATTSGEPLSREAKAYVKKIILYQVQQETYMPTEVVDQIKTLVTTCGFTGESFQDSTSMTTIKEFVIKRVRSGSTLLRLAKAIPLSELIHQDTEIQKNLLWGFNPLELEDSSYKRDSEDIAQLIKTYLHSTNIPAVLERCFTEFCEDSYRLKKLDSAIIDGIRQCVSEAEFQHIGVIGLKTAIEKMNHLHSFQLKIIAEKFNLSQEIFEKEDIVEVMKTWLLKYLRNEYPIFYAETYQRHSEEDSNTDKEGIDDYLALSSKLKEFFETPSGKNELALNIGSYIGSNCYGFDLGKEKKPAAVVDAFIVRHQFSAHEKNTIIQRAIAKDCDNKPSRGDRILELLHHPYLSDPSVLLSDETQQAFEKLFPFSISHNPDLLAEFPFSPNFLQDEVLNERAKTAFADTVAHPSPVNLELAKKISERFKIPEDKIPEIIKDKSTWGHYSNENLFKDIATLKEAFLLEESDCIQIGTIAILKKLDEIQGNLSNRFKLEETKSLHFELLNTEEETSFVLKVVTAVIANLLSKDDSCFEKISLIRQFLKKKNLEDNSYLSPTVQEAYQKFILKKCPGYGLKYSHKHKSSDNGLVQLLSPSNNFNVSDEILLSEPVFTAIEKKISDLVLEKQIGNAISLHELGPYKSKIILTDEAQQFFVTHVLEFLSPSNWFDLNLPEDKSLDEVLTIIGLANENRELFGKGLVALITEYKMAKDHRERFLGYLEKLGFDISFFIKNTDKASASMCRNFDIETFTQLSGFIDSNPEYVRFSERNGDEEMLLNTQDLQAFSGIHPIFKKDLVSCELAKKVGFRPEITPQENDFKQLFNSLREKHPNWKDERTISGPFELGAGIFGYKRMFEYTLREGLSLHDALHTFGKTVELYNASGLTSNQFHGQILNQVMNDSATYRAGSAHHHLNEIVQTIDTDFTKNLKLAREFAEIPEIGELATILSSPETIFASWNNLKRYSNLTQLLGEREVLEKLQAIKNPRLRSYVAHLAFHKDSKVNMQAAIEFAVHPESFFEREASHTPEDIQDRKKPSNYTHIPNLDLSAAELVDSLVDGKMDGLSVFTPMEITYIVSIDEESLDTHSLLKKALGVRAKEGVDAIAGEAKDTKKLFFEVNKLLKLNRSSVQEYLSNNNLSETVTTYEFTQELLNLIFHPDFGLRRKTARTQTYIAKIGKKSDPNMVLAGDDTVNCMPFGDGKTTVYTFNPNTAQLVIQIVKPDGKRRTIAQSVLTKDIDIKKAIPDVIRALEQSGKQLSDVLPEDLLSNQSTYIACDNVEVSPNFKDQASTITALYRDFFRQYMDAFGVQQNLQQKQVVVGEGYSDALDELPEISNVFAPQAPVSYSDKTGSKVRRLDLNGVDSAMILSSTVTEKDTPPIPINPPDIMPGLEFLTFQHALQVSFIEGKAYADNTSLMQYLHNMENGLIAKDINNSAKNRPNMSLAYRDTSGKMQGYLLAYEGKLSEDFLGGDEEDEFDWQNQEVIYITDTAVTHKSSMAGAKAGAALINGFVELYRKNYVNTGRLLPIFTQAREETSFHLIQRKLAAMAKDLGIEFELEQFSTYREGKSVMHPVLIKPKLI